MKNIIEYLNEGFFSNVRGSLSDVKKLLAPIFEMSNPKKYLNKNTVYDVLVKLPEKFGFDIYNYDRESQTEIIENLKVTKEEDDMFWVRFGTKKGTSVSHCDTESTVKDIQMIYAARLPLKVVMTYDGDEVK